MDPHEVAAKLTVLELNAMGLATVFVKKDAYGVVTHWSVAPTALGIAVRDILRGLTNVAEYDG